MRNVGKVRAMALNQVVEPHTREAKAKQFTAVEAVVEPTP